MGALTHKLNKTALFLSMQFLVTGLVVAQTLPNFVLQCTDVNSKSTYRLASDGNAIYFANIENKLDLKATNKSVSTLVEPRVIRMVFQEGDVDNRIFKMARPEGDTYEVQGVLARDTLALSIGNRNYSCRKINDVEITQSLKSAYENEVLQTIQKQNTYDNKPNQL